MPPTNNTAEVRFEILFDNQWTPCAVGLRTLILEARLPWWRRLLRSLLRVVRRVLKGGRGG